jgi:hypothetical protein
MSFNLGLDNRALLPPFMPVQRNQDGVFAGLVRACFDGGFFGFLPWVVLHRPPTRPVASADYLRKTIARPTSSQVFLALIRGLAPGPTKREARSSLHALGTALTDVGSITPAVFDEIARLHLWNQMSKQALHWENQLRRFGGQPAFWADDVKNLLTAMREDLPSPDYAVPSDLVDAFGLDQARSLLQRLVRKLGLLLQTWPDMMVAAQDLRAKGIRLANRI